MEVLAPKKENRIILMNDNSNERQFIEKCELKAKTVCNPIIEWKHSDIWEYIHSEKIETNSLYQCGYYRVGCIGCPMANKSRYKEFADYPTYKNNYIHAFDRMLSVLKGKWTKQPPQWKTGGEVFLWWMEDKNVEGQMSIFDIGIEKLNG